MKLTNEDINQLFIDTPPAHLEKHAKYGDYCDDIADVDEYKDVAREQIMLTFEEINRLRGEIPIAFHWWRNKLENGSFRVGWYGWTDKETN